MNIVFTSIVVLLPILDIYISPVSNVGFGTFCLLLCSPLVYAGVIKKGRLKVPFPVLILLCYMLLGSLVSYVISIPDDLAWSLLRMGRFIFVLSTVLLAGRQTLFDYSFSKRVWRLVNMLAVGYVMIQSVAYYAAGRLLPSVALHLVQSDLYARIDYEAAARTFYRPGSFFLEPAHFAQYTLVYLSYSLFGDCKTQKTDLKMAAFITAGLLLSTSATAIFLSALLWAIWLWCRIRAARPIQKAYWIGAAMLFLALGVPTVVQLPIIAASVERVITPSGALGPASGRLFTYDQYQRLHDLEKCIGTGYGNVPGGYLNGMAYVLYCSGVVGLLLVYWMLLNAFVHTRYGHKYACLIYALLLPIAQVFTAEAVSYYFMFIYEGYQSCSKLRYSRTNEACAGNSKANQLLGTAHTM